MMEQNWIARRWEEYRKQPGYLNLADVSVAGIPLVVLTEYLRPVERGWVAALIVGFIIGNALVVFMQRAPSFRPSNYAPQWVVIVLSLILSFILIMWIN